jgi:hypothetical protein
LNLIGKARALAGVWSVRLSRTLALTRVSISYRFSRPQERRYGDARETQTQAK